MARRYPALYPRVRFLDSIVHDQIDAHGNVPEGFYEHLKWELNLARWDATAAAADAAGGSEAAPAAGAGAREPASGEAGTATRADGVRGLQLVLRAAYHMLYKYLPEPRITDEQVVHTWAHHDPACTCDMVPFPYARLQELDAAAIAEHIAAFKHRYETIATPHRRQIKERAQELRTKAQLEYPRSKWARHPTLFDGTVRAEWLAPSLVAAIEAFEAARADAYAALAGSAGAATATERLASAVKRDRDEGAAGGAGGAGAAADTAATTTATPSAGSTTSHSDGPGTATNGGTLTAALDAARRAEAALRGVLREESTGVYSFDLFSREFCDMLVDELVAHEESPLPSSRPNSMNNYGLIVNDIGMQPLIDALMARYLRPLAALLFPDDGGASVDEHHSFMVQYMEDADVKLDMHVDDSEVTVNVNLCDTFEGSGLTFCGRFHDPRHRKAALTYSHVLGRAVIHAGKHRHGAHPISKGDRVNLIVWMRSTEFRDGEGFRRVQTSAESQEEPDLVCMSRTHDRDWDRWVPAGVKAGV